LDQPSIPRWPPAVLLSTGGKKAGWYAPGRSIYRTLDPRHKDAENRLAATEPTRVPERDVGFANGGVWGVHTVPTWIR
jgi:hypothetical protein